MVYSVQAKENSVSGGVGKVAGIYERGNFIVITCDLSDKWSLQPEPPLICNANGLDNSRSSTKGQTFNNGTMVGSIDGGNSFFPVGTRCELTITTDFTNLTLYCWDSDNNNNSGAINANIQVLIES